MKLVNIRTESHTTVNGSVKIEHHEWNPPGITMDERARVGSAWRVDGKGKKLTNARILYYQRMGYYGREAQEKALAAIVREGHVVPCGCGKTINIRYCNYSYLPKPGHYCPQCIDVHRASRDKEKEQRREWSNRMIREYV